MSDSTFNLGTVIDDAKKVITNPVDFYRNMPTEGGYADPLIFVAVMGAVTGLLTTIFSLVGLGVPGGMIGGFALMAIIMIPIAFVIGSFIGAAIIFVVWKLMGSDKDYETAYRCTAYSFAISPVMAIISIIPYLAGIIKTLWGFFLLYVASIEVHQIKAQTAKIVFGVLTAIFVFVGFGAERSARNIAHWGDRAEKAMSNANVPEMFKDLENMEDMTPEEAGKQVGEFMKGLGAFSKGMEEAIKEAEKEAEEE